MATPNSRATLIQYCLRNLGAPTIKINIDDDQIDDRIDEALTLFTEFHMDATLKTYVVMNVTQNNINTQSFQMEPSVINVNRVFPILGSTTTSGGLQNFNIFDLNYQLRLNELYDFTSADYVYYELAQQHIRTLEILFNGETPIRFNRYDGNLYVDGLADLVVVGSVVIAEAYTILPSNNALVWNDIWLKKYATCLIKRQWGANLSKFSDVPIVGGVKLNGDKIYNDAVVEQKELERELRDTFESPIPWIAG